MMPMRMPPALRGALRGGQLLVGDPLQPDMERDAVRQVLAQLRHEGRCDVPGFGGALLPGAERRGEMLLEGAPQGEIQQRLSLARRVRIEQGLPRRRPRRGEDELQRRAFRGPRRIAVDAFGVGVRRCDLPSKSVQPGIGRMPGGTPPRGCPRDAHTAGRGSAASPAGTVTARSAR